MSSAGSWPMRITAAPGAVGATVVTRSHGRLSVTAIVKATFAFAQGRPMTPAAPEPIAIADEHLDRSPARSLAAASDLAPYLPRADVLLRGHACAFRGEPVASLAVRLVVARDKDVVLNKRLLAQGGRDRAGRPVLFARMPLVYELAAGGMQSSENPVGVPVRAGDEPNLVDPAQRGRPVGFGPIARKWPVRRRQLGALDPQRLEAPIPEIPDGFPWAYFNAAPEDQRLDQVRGDEWIVLDGMNAEIERMESCLPAVHGVARLYGPSPELHAGRPIRLVGDTLIIDADRQLCSVVLRGSFPIAGDGDLAVLQVYAGVESAGRPVAFPAAYVEPVAPMRAQRTPVPAEMPIAPMRAQRTPVPAEIPIAPMRAQRTPVPAEIPIAPMRAQRTPVPVEMPIAPMRAQQTPVPAEMPTASRPRRPPETAVLTAFDIESLRQAPVIPFAGGAEHAPAPAHPPLPPATPFERAPPGSPWAAPSATRPPGPTRPPVDFSAETQPLPPMRPAGPTRPPEPEPLEDEKPLFAYVPRDLAARHAGDPSLASSAAQAAAALPPEPSLAPIAEPEPPRTLGGHFLAAMARAGFAAPPPS